MHERNVAGGFSGERFLLSARTAVLMVRAVSKILCGSQSVAFHILSATIFSARCLVWFGVALTVANLSVRRVGAQDFGSADPSQLALPTQRLMIEQIEELAAAGEYAEAIQNLEKLFDTGQGRIVESGLVQRAGTQQTLRYIPLREWSQKRLVQLLQSNPEINAQYQTRVFEVARTALDEAAAVKDLAETRLAADRFYATTLGPDFGLLLSDLYLEQGWSLAAVQVAQRVSEDMRADLSNDGTQQGTFAWSFLWRTPETEEHARSFADAFKLLLRRQTHSGQSRSELLVEALSRVVMAAEINPRAVDVRATREWTRFMAGLIESEDAQTQLKDLLDRSATWPSSREAAEQWSTFTGDNSRNADSVESYDLNRSPSWTHLVERFTATSDRISASKPRVGELERGTLPYFPLIVGDKVYINELLRIVALDSKTGRSWPDIKPTLPLFDSRISAGAFLPLGYPLVGVPRATMSYGSECLYARMGGPVTGWANKEGAADGGSLSYLVGLDLKRQGSMLRGFPLRLKPPEFEGAEFEGAPLVWGDLLMVAVVERDSVGLARSVGAFDRVTGKLVWRTGVLATGSVDGAERANLISNQLLTEAGGRVYYSTNLGSIVCLDPLTGRTEWLVRYRRTEKERQAYPSPDRYRYRDLTPCLVSEGLVYCAPQDCPEIFALDATTGDLVWSTDDNQVADAIHMLGVHGDCLVVSGDRLAWFDRRTGRQLGIFPGSITPGIANALPSPRGLGRGLISGSEVYWPTAGEILVFSANLSKGSAAEGRQSPPIVRRIRLDSRGREGGNLIAAGKWLLFSSPDRVLAFEQRPASPPIENASAEAPLR